MDESISFYKKLGFKLVLYWEDPNGQLKIVKIAHLKLGETFLEIFRYRGQSPAPASASSLATDLPRVGVKHFALQVESVYKTKEFVEKEGLATEMEICEGKTGVTYFFIKDPSCILVEFLEDNRNL